MSPLIQTLSDLVRINSVNSSYDDGPGEAEVAAYVRRFFEQRGMEVSEQVVFPGRNNVLVRLPGRNPDRRLVLEAHMDTVSIKGMTIPPFEPAIAGGRLYGRGAVDDKAGLATMMHAIAAIHESGKKPPCDVLLAAVVDEEFSFRGVVKLVERLAPACSRSCVEETPSAAQSSGHRQDAGMPPSQVPAGLEVEGHSTPRDDGSQSGPAVVAAIVAEPTEMRAVIASKGTLRWRIIVRGRAAHSAKPHLGINAVSHMARIVLELEKDHAALAAMPHPLLGPATCNVGVIRGGVQVNFVPDECHIEIDRRMLPGEPARDVLAHYQGIIEVLKKQHPDLDAVMEPPMLVDEALETSVDSGIVRAARATLRGMGLDDTACGVPFCSDASKLSRAGIPTIIFGPGSIDRAHVADEYVEIDQVEQAFEFQRRLISTFE